MTEGTPDQGVVNAASLAYELEHGTDGPDVSAVDRNAEVSCLSACLLEPDAAPSVLEQLSPEHFTGALRRALFVGLRRALDTHGTVDTHLLARELEQHGVTLPTRASEALLSACPTSANALLYVADVRAAHHKRQRRTLVENLQIADPERVPELAAQLCAHDDALDRSRRHGRVRTGTELVDAVRRGELRHRPVLIQGLLRRGDIFVLFGPAGMGKSQLAISLSTSLALGGEAAPYVLDDPANPLWRVTPPDPTRVLYVNAEDDEVDLGHRLADHLAARAVAEPPDTLVTWTPLDAERNLGGQTGRNRLERLIRKHKPQVVVVDNLTNVLAGLDKSSEAEVTEWINAVPRRLRDRYGVTVVLLGHTNKGTADGDPRSAMDRLFGSMAWAACADGMVMLDWVQKQPGRRRLIHAKSRGFAPFDTAVLEKAEGDCVFPVVDVGETAAKRQRSRGGATARDYAEALRLHAEQHPGEWVSRRGWAALVKELTEGNGSVRQIERLAEEWIRGELEGCVESSRQGRGGGWHYRWCSEETAS